MQVDTNSSLNIYLIYYANKMAAKTKVKLFLITNCISDNALAIGKDTRQQ